MNNSSLLLLANIFFVAVGFSVYARNNDGIALMVGVMNALAIASYFLAGLHV